MTVAICWFRRDLRLGDHPALTAALGAADEVLPLFVDDPALAGPAGANRRWFLRGALADLADRTGGALVIRRGRPEDVVAAVAAEVGATQVWCTADGAPYGRARDERVGEVLTARGVALCREGTHYAVAPGRLHTKGGTPFRVFTPFSKAWRAHGWDRPRAAPDAPRWHRGPASEGLGEAVRPTAEVELLPVPGEDAALDRLDLCLEGIVERYGEDRDRPDLDGTTRLSTALKWGCIHPRQILDRLGPGRGAEKLASELAWRDFYADVLWHEPSSARRALVPAMAGMELDEGPVADERFAAWAEGRTGYPIVDAGMRQLRASGWMHNRVRMIVASFLVKDLHIDWTRGARHFMEHLVDGDLASNQHGWQWVAGTGTDAAPYFRVFNPTSQGLRFDPDGDYVRRWVPELAEVPGPAVHEPRRAAGDLFAPAASAYPGPIVDHAAERDEALARWRRATGREQ